MIRVRALPFLAVLLLVACQGDSSQAPIPKFLPQPKLPIQAKRGPTPEELTAGMVEAATVGKSTVPISLKFDLSERPVVGRPLDIVIAVLPQVAGAATLQVSGSDGLSVAPGVGTIDLPSLDPTQAYRVTIGTTPIGVGIQILSLSVSLTHEDSTETRTFSVPVIVAAAADAVAAGPAGVRADPNAASAAKATRVDPAGVSKR